MFGAIFGVLGGVFGAIAGVFGIGKKSEYFLELDEAADNVKAAIEAAPKAVEKALSAAGSSTADNKADKTEKAPVAAKKAPAKPKVEKTKPAPAPVAAPEPAVINFATEYLGSSGSSGRRRPGPSLSPFMDLARQVKAPAK
ncbi:hypothetical protein H6G13_24630 [Pseudanabaena sp. FACHB-2040]|nr:hypothetical protein [Pseudanabaena sp. FACHB-2040]